MITSGLFTSNTCEWATPQWLFDELNEEFHFDLDVCANEFNHKCDLYFSRIDDGLSQIWSGSCFMNPPYGREIGKWVKKAYFSSKDINTTVVCLLPSRTDTKWWHDYCMKGEIRFIKGRLKFNDGKKSAPFPSAIVIFR